MKTRHLPLKIMIMAVTTVALAGCGRNSTSTEASPPAVENTQPNGQPAASPAANNAGNAPTNTGANGTNHLQ